ncbi:hypothetical protein PENANT_c095G05612 [Penicillium antarcticum]|uniref:Uncharacterized protein n=1 Tax=Penicillium antarcticum TaxID=416450 RepID=A0A1V6PMR5_9EURO|nr:hypothetical protein PENANT_c095G05612 [Penicillium antarcticum]
MSYDPLTYIGLLELLRTDSDIYNDIGVILSEEFSGLDWTLFEFLNIGGFNTCFKMKFTNNRGAVIRFLLPGAVMFPKEKASSYFEDLAELHLVHLGSQRNEADTLADIDADDLADDFRRKFVARFLFRKLVRDQEQRKQWISHDNSLFLVWYDDFRPENILVDKAECIAGVVDWEFTYTAPVEFSYAPPWWLLLKKPEDWPKGLDDWCAEYKKALQVFLVAMRQYEDEAIQKKLLVEGQRLSSRMRDSWRSGDFWIMYAARNNFAFDAIYWKKLDQRFFGPTIYEDDNICDLWRKRLHLLEPEEKKLMEEYVNLKLKDRNTWRLDWDPDEYTEGWIKRLKIKKEEREKEEREEKRLQEKQM